MNLWGFTPAFHQRLQAAMAAATDASEEAEVLLPEVVADRSPRPRSPCCRRPGAASGSPIPTTWRWCRPSWPARSDRASGPPRCGRPAGAESRRGPHADVRPAGPRVPDATQPRVTVRPKPPVLLGATSETHRRRRAGIVSDNPDPGLVRRLQGSHHSVTRTICCRKLPPAPAASSLRNSVPTLDPALRLSLGHLPVRLAASLPASLRPTLRRSVRVRRAFVSELVTALRLLPHKVNAVSRNPHVLPTFLRVIPK